MRRSSLAFAFALASLACDATREPSSSPTPATTTPEPEPAPRELPPFEPIVEAGPAYFLVRDRGVVRLSEAGEFAPLPGAPAIGGAALGLDSGGALYLLGVTELAKFDDAQGFVRLIEIDYQQIGAAMELAFGPEGSVWVRGTDGVGRYHEGRWTSFDRAALAIPDASLVGIAADREGRAWLATLDGLRFYEPSTPAPSWQAIDTRWPQHEGTFLGLVARADHRVYVVGTDTLDRFEPSEGLVARPFLPPGIELLAGELALSGRGRLALASSSCDLIRLDPERSDTLRILPGTPSWGCEDLGALAYDASDRAWIGSSAGVHVLGETDSVFYRSGSVLPLAGWIESIAVWGSGPTTLPSPTEPARFTLRATLVRAGKPIAGAPVEVCPQLSLAGGSPCAHSPHRVTATTDRKGKLAIELAIGDYDLAVQVAGVWENLFQASFAGTLQAGGVLDLGELVVED